LNGVCCSDTCNPAGTCVTQIASGQKQPAIIVLNSGIFWTTTGGIMGVDVYGETMLAASSAPTGLAVDSRNAYWTDSPANGPATVNEVSLASGATVTLVSGLVSAKDVAVDSTSAYFIATASDGGSQDEIMSVPLAGGTPTVLFTDVCGRLSGLAVDSSNVYWMEHRGMPAACDGTTGAVLLSSVPKAGGTPTTLVVGQTDDWSTSLAEDSANLYWASAAQVNGPTGELSTVPKTGGAPTTLASGLRSPRGIAVDSANVYWTDDNTGAEDGTVTTVAKTGGTPTTLASGLDNPLGIAVGSTGVLTGVLWVEGSSPVYGRVMAVGLQ